MAYPLLMLMQVLKDMHAMRVLLISEGEAETAELERAITAGGHQLMAAVELQNGFVQRLAALSIDLVVMNISSVKAGMLKDLQLLTIPVVIFAAEQGEVSADEIIQSGVSAYVVDGFKPERVSAVIELALARFKQLDNLRQQLLQSRQELEERKDIERAKGIIMKQKQCSEDDAYRVLRKTAMDQNRRIGEVARNIVSLAALLG